MSEEHIVQLEKLDLTIYGQVQYSYKVDGVSGRTLSDACVTCAALRAASVDQEVSAVSAVTKRRADVLEKIGNALAAIAAAVASLAGSEDLDETVSGTARTNLKNQLGTINTYVPTWEQDGNTYPTISDTNSNALSNWQASNVTSDKGQKLQSVVQLFADTEDNALQRTSSTLQSFMSKRDSAYSLIGKIQRKLDGTAKQTIQAFQ